MASPANKYVNAAAIAADDKIWMAGYWTFSSSGKPLVMKVDTFGDIEFVKEITPLGRGTPATTFIEGMDMDSSGNAVLVGRTKDFDSSGKWYAFLSKP